MEVMALPKNSAEAQVRKKTIVFEEEFWRRKSTRTLSFFSRGTTKW